MKQVAQNYKSGELLVLDVPPPVCAPGDHVLIGKYAGIEVRDPDTHELLALVDEAEVMGRYDEHAA